MAEIEFLTVINDEGFIPEIKGLFTQFQNKRRISVDATFVGWDTIWRELVNVGIYRRGADVVEVGTTWLESLVAMNTLRPFTMKEINQLGGKAAYIPATWTSTTIGEDAQIWGIPIRSDVRVIWYWKDMFEDAKIDPATAFTNPQSTQDSLEKLKSVIETPWLVTTAFGDPNSIQSLATWIWAVQSDFVTSDCKKVLLMEPAELDALRAYFGLYQYMPKDTLDLESNELADLFLQRKTAAIFAGPWVMSTLIDRGMPQETISRLGIARTPGPPFVGGTVLSVYQHSRRIPEVMDFIKFMVQPEIQVQYSPPVGLLPTRHAAWEMPSAESNSYYKEIYQAFENGRGLPAVPLWGMVEDKLKNSIYLIWKDLLTNPKANVDQAIQTYLEPIVKRLNISLQ